MIFVISCFVHFFACWIGFFSSVCCHLLTLKKNQEHYQSVKQYLVFGKVKISVDNASFKGNVLMDILTHSNICQDI